jgi:hypothetical protein
VFVHPAWKTILFKALDELPDPQKQSSLDRLGDHLMQDSRRACIHRSESAPTTSARCRERKPAPPGLQGHCEQTSARHEGTCDQVRRNRAPQLGGIRHICAATYRVLSCRSSVCPSWGACAAPEAPSADWAGRNGLVRPTGLAPVTDATKAYAPPAACQGLRLRRRRPAPAPGRARLRQRRGRRAPTLRAQLDTLTDVCRALRATTG